MGIMFRNGKISIARYGKKEETINVLFAGDVCPIRETERLIMDGRTQNILSPLGGLFFDRDLAVVNLEAPLTKVGVPIPKTGPNIRLDPGCVEFLKEARFDIVSLANNHMGDYGPLPVTETMDILRKNGIMHTGAGTSLKDTGKPLFLERNGIKLAMLSYAEYEFGIAGENTPGVFPLDTAAAIRDIGNAKTKADIILVVIHGGNEQCPVPNPAMVNAYRAFASAGADAVVSMHTHCPQGIEIYQGVPIVYSLGNFLFDYPHDKGRPEKDNFWWKGYMVKIVFSSEGAISLEAVPYSFWPDASSVKPLEGNEKESFYRYLAHISDIITDEKERSLLWDAWCLTAGPWWMDFFRKAEYPVNKENSDMYINTMVLRNGFTCSAHYEVLKNFLRMICEDRLEAAEKYTGKLKNLQKGMIE